MATDLARLHLELQRLGATVAVAESLTGGLLLAALTETPGASLSVRGGLVVYATDLKAQLAGVDADLLAERGAVDPDVAIALARGVRDRLHASIGIGVTGVAGPDPQDGQPVGTVFGATSSVQGDQAWRWTFLGDRQEIRAAAVQACVGLLEELVADLGRASRESSG
jgi:nicotinamide-nucleotide amidase